MVKKIVHIGVIVRNLEASLERYTSLLSLKVKEIEETKVENIIHRMAFLPIGEASIELVQTTGNVGPAADFLKKNGEGIHHIAFEVENLEKKFRELRSKGVKFLWDKVVEGSRGSKVAFFKAEEFNGVYIELVQKD